ncbi:YutD family protein [Vagococcus carniphilus]|uniref:YutD family protein n=1 Tax=Vagococcus carniphilus TaxID=218144 RepID=UPI003B5C2C60
MTEEIKEISTTEEVIEIEEEVDEVLQEMLANYNPESFPLANGTYKLVKNYRDGFDYETLIKRYNSVLEKYDYIVGDWGYDQLRLKGFFMDDFKGAPLDAKISTLEDYLYEYCNFGCAYFVIQQTGEFKRRGRTSQGPNNKKNNKPKNKAYTDEKKFNTNKKNKKPKFKGKNNNQQQAPKKAKEATPSKHQFTIRKKEAE